MAATFEVVSNPTVDRERTRILLDDLTQALTIVNQCRKNDVAVKQEFLDYIERILDEIDKAWLGSVQCNNPEFVS